MTTFITGEELLELLRARRGDRSLREFAQELGTGYQMLGSVLAGQKSPGRQIPEALGYVAMTVYTPKKAGKK